MGVLNLSELNVLLGGGSGQKKQVSGGVTWKSMFPSISASYLCTLLPSSYNKSTFPPPNLPTRPSLPWSHTLNLLSAVN